MRLCVSIVIETWKSSRKHKSCHLTKEHFLSKNLGVQASSRYFFGMIFFPLGPYVSPNVTGFLGEDFSTFMCSSSILYFYRRGHSLDIILTLLRHTIGILVKTKMYSTGNLSQSIPSNW